MNLQQSCCFNRWLAPGKTGGFAGDWSAKLNFKQREFIIFVSYTSPSLPPSRSFLLKWALATTALAGHFRAAVGIQLV